VSDVSLVVQTGEIVGIAGLLGSGRTTLLELIFGARAAAAGRLIMDGRTVTVSTPGEGTRAGFVYVPETRGLSGFFGMSITVNIGATVVKTYAPFGRFRHRHERRDARALIRQYTIRCQSLEQNFEHLSGGNQQKVIVARSIRAHPRVLLLDEPTQGVDVGARADIHGFLHAAASSGLSVVVVSSDLEELATISDRIIILREGYVSGELRGPSIDPDAVVAAVYGGVAATHA
jgi:ribose transport system ATP-binding protein